jgi:hypothetical protein
MSYTKNASAIVLDQYRARIFKLVIKHHGHQLTSVVRRHSLKLLFDNFVIEGAKRLGHDSVYTIMYMALRTRLVTS